MDAGGKGRGWDGFSTRTVDAKEGLRDDTDRSSCRFSPALWTWVGHVLDAGLGLGLIWPSPSEAAKLSQVPHRSRCGWAAGAGPERRSRSSFPPQAIDIPSWRKARRPHTLRFLFMAASICPRSIQTLITGSQQGENPVGPLNFDSLVKVEPGHGAQHVEAGRRRHAHSKLPGRVLATSRPIRVQAWTRPRGLRVTR